MTRSEPRYDNCWIARDGGWYAVQQMGHYSVARLILGTGDTVDPCGVLESMGWLHIGIDGGSYPYVYTEREPTQAQVDVLYDMAMLAPPSHIKAFFNAVREHISDFGKVE